MGLVLPAGWAVLIKPRTVVSLCFTKKAAKRRLKQERAAGNDAYLVELYCSDGLLER